MLAPTKIETDRRRMGPLSGGTGRISAAHGDTIERIGNSEFRIQNRKKKKKKKENEEGNRA
jgi:hypothetical protein